VPGLLEGLLLLVVELVPQLHRDEQEVRDAHVLIEGVELRHFVEFLGNHGRMVVLCAVDDAGLQRGIELGPRHRHAGRAENLHSVDHHRRGHHANLLTLEIVGRAHSLLREEIGLLAVRSG